MDTLVFFAAACLATVEGTLMAWEKTYIERFGVVTCRYTLMLCTGHHCFSDEFECNGRCIYYTKVCDGYSDCGSFSSDEENCGKCVHTKMHFITCISGLYIIVPYSR